MDENFYVKNQHSYKSYNFSLSKGEHKIKIESGKGNATIEKNFEIVNKHSAIVEYFYSPRDGNTKQFYFKFGKDELLMID